MQEIDIVELKAIQIQILDVVSDFCDKNGIHYWLDSGTLIGAVRHRGYIPWDDDIDLGMLRPDYDRFAKEFNLQGGKYRFCCIENTPRFTYPCGKVFDTDTVLFEPNEEGVRSSVNIDVFVYDNAPADDREVERMYNRRDRLMYLRDVRLYSPIQKQKNPVKKLGIWLANTIPPGCLESRISRNSKRYADKDTGRVGNFTAIVRMCASKRIFDSFTEVEFEGKKYKAPVGYDEWLRLLYGDYMQLPPEEKRVSHHLFKAYK